MYPSILTYTALEREASLNVLSHNAGRNTEEYLNQLEDILRYYDELRETYGMQSLNMAEAAQANAEGTK